MRENVWPEMDEVKVTERERWPVGGKGKERGWESKRVRNE